MHRRGVFTLVCCLILSAVVYAQRPPKDAFLRFIEETKLRMPVKQKEVGTIPSDDELRKMGYALTLFRSHMYDSCKSILSKFNYTLVQMVDVTTGATYDIIKEQTPIRRGWGTFVYNRNHTKRLYIHVNHPVDDPGINFIGAEMFRTLGAEWLFIAGTPRYTHPLQAPQDVGRVKRTVFERWHEMLTDLTHISISLHAYRSGSFRLPIRASDVVVSNGRTTDEQWGISQISLAFRDSLRAGGVKCGLAMYDSGFASLAGGWNTQGVFSNDSVGFGHWLYLELSEKVRENSPAYRNFIAAANRALELTGKKVSKQMNLAWGLVSPRVVRIDSSHRMLFPPPGAETYRIISFDANTNRSDTMDLRIGNWIEMGGASKTITRVTRLDSTERLLAHGIAGSDPEREVARVVRESPHRLPERIQHAREALNDSTLGDDESIVREPLQVHRIPLQPVLSSTVSNNYVPEEVTFKWEGILPGQFSPNVLTFGMREGSSLSHETIANFLIPIINSSYRDGKSRFIGVQMTRVLVDEIARLLDQHDASDKDVGLMAERMQSGDYYLRVFPAADRRQLASIRP